jgi:hypothetical protein
VGIEEQANFGLTIAQLLFEFGASGGGFGHGRLLEENRVLNGRQECTGTETKI